MKVMACCKVANTLKEKEKYYEYEKPKLHCENDDFRDAFILELCNLGVTSFPEYLR